jgi:dUTP pyrophosphatase
MIKSLRYAKLSPLAKTPFRKNYSDAGLDFYSIESVTIPPHTMQILHTGITIEIPEGYALVLRPKSKNNFLLGAGILDAYYQPGEVLVKVCNVFDKDLQISIGDGIAQGLFIPIETPELEEVDVEELKVNNPRSGTGGIVNQLNPDTSKIYIDTTNITYS